MFLEIFNFNQFKILSFKILDSLFFIKTITPQSKFAYNITSMYEQVGFHVTSMSLSHSFFDMLTHDHFYFMRPSES
jgi:hypothetical protein